MYRVAIVTCPPRGALTHGLAELPPTGDFVPPPHTLGWTLIPAGESADRGEDIHDADTCTWQHIAIVAAARRAGRVTTPRVLRAMQQMVVPRSRWPIGVRTLSQMQVDAARIRLRTPHPGSRVGVQMEQGVRGPIGVGTTETTALYSLLYGANVACAENGRVNVGLILRKLVEYPMPDHVFALETGTP